MANKNTIKLFLILRKFFFFFFNFKKGAFQLRTQHVENCQQKELDLHTDDMFWHIKWLVMAKV